MSPSRIFQAFAALVCVWSAPAALAQTGKCCLPDGRCFTQTADWCAARDGGIFVPGEVCANSGDTCDVPVTGACCPHDGSACAATTSAACTSGAWNSGTCSPDPCGATGACCTGTTCTTGRITGCAGGVFSVGLSCAGNPCNGGTTGKCCADGRCTTTTQTTCAQSAGSTFVPDTTCSSIDDTCPEPPVQGACCPTVGGECSFGVAANCPSGAPFYPNSACSSTICTPPTYGACCQNFVCSQTSPLDCSSGVYHADTPCNPTICGVPPSSACCNGTTCTTLQQAPCINGGGEWFPEGSCAQQDFCRLGACCRESHCVVTSGPGCEPPSVFVQDGVCSDTICSEPTGSCCRDTGTCVVTIAGDCLNGTYVASGFCQTLNCTPPATGACCQGHACSALNQSSCLDASGAYQGDNVSCGTAGNPTACCRANYDQINGLQTSDIFAFLNDWFAGETRADFDGGGLATSDIFAFLNAWFAGCSG